MVARRQESCDTRSGRWHKQEILCRPNRLILQKFQFCCSRGPQCLEDSASELGHRYKMRFKSINLLAQCMLGWFPTHLPCRVAKSRPIPYPIRPYFRNGKRQIFLRSCLYYSANLNLMFVSLKDNLSHNGWSIRLWKYIIKSLHTRSTSKWHINNDVLLNMKTLQPF